MKAILLTGVVAVATLAAYPRVVEAQAARFRYLASVYADAQGTGFNLPEGVACGHKGEVVVGETGNDRLVRFNYQDKAFSGGTEIKFPQLLAPARVQLNSKGEIFALDSTQRRIVHLTAAGEFKSALAFEGAPPPKTVIPKGFALDSADSIYVLDVFSSRVLVLNAEGQFQKVLPLPDGTGFISDLTVDATGTVFLIDSINRRLFSAAKDATAFSALGGDLKEYLATLPTFITTSKGTIFVVEGNDSRIVGFGRDGTFLTRQMTMGWSEGALNHPSQICINDKDEVFVADRDNSRIQVFQLMR